MNPPPSDATLVQLLTYAFLSAGGVGSAWAVAKGIGAWVAGQLAAKDAIIAAKDTEIARINAEADRRVDECTQRCAAEAREAHAEVIGILREVARKTSGSSSSET